ncbi:asparagine synthase (glutamine-hydrolyzing) [Sulfurospirillum barnesii]|uniref:asparagine synthase (glutamine-hydrolyzing) n=1 Tax=Sulfurospirillum barnesii (strain ATCC 700032 / DSM 10660 / SES-3) TaxID=760154 RepID=I3Y0K5_SULBS|nr:asparagine synthase (glutamine-hydrolyzing) [Sulfurospirillum barnesii]AFL69729.1 asparagine synthase, glutamine-hydrolyzing [Sulfurospirillum barnesii SES-3]
MCAIFGFVAPKNQELLEKMAQSLRHRGPDDRGFWQSDECSLGLDRLAILDIKGGMQPCVKDTIVSVMNGEIYNFQALRIELESLGYAFSSNHSDAEVIPFAYKEWGLDFVDHLEGMFAIALWDSVLQNLILVSDPVGKKPCYYTLEKGDVYFASEIKALLHVKPNPSICEKALYAFLAKKTVASPYSIYEDILQVPPATMMIFHQGVLVNERRYWTPCFDGSLVFSSEDEYVKLITESLERSVKMRAQMDVEFGAFLSGGLDSSLVATLTAQHTSKQLETFTLVYEDSIEGKDDDERFAQIVAERIGAKRHIYRLGHEEVWSSLSKVLRAFDEPFSATISPYFLCSLVAQHVKVALCGDGADELFGSYFTHRNSAKLDEIKNYQLSNGLWRKKLNVFSDEELSMLFGKYISTPELFFGGAHAITQLHQTLEGEFCDQLPNQVLKYADRLSMAHSVEIRSPFLDRSFIELVGHIPSSLKIKEQEVKYILKKVALQFLPKELVFRPKEGFVLPIWRWMDSVWKDRIKETLKMSDINVDFGIQQAYVDSLVREWENGASHHAKIWSLVVLTIWNKERKYGYIRNA